MLPKNAIGTNTADSIISDTDQRTLDFPHGFTRRFTRCEASRCLTCGEYSIFEWTCPLHNHIPQWIELGKAGDIDAAVTLSHQTNCLPKITGRVCLQDRRCEGARTPRDEYGAVTIGNIECYISDRALIRGWRPELSDVQKLDKRVAIISAGPAGLACTDVLVCNGVSATVYDHHPEIGSLLTFGIPAFKLGKLLLVRRRELFSAMGIRLGLTVKWGMIFRLRSYWKPGSCSGQRVSHTGGCGNCCVWVSSVRYALAGIIWREGGELGDVLSPVSRERFVTRCPTRKFSPAPILVVTVMDEGRHAT